MSRIDEREGIESLGWGTLTLRWRLYADISLGAAVFGV